MDDLSKSFGNFSLDIPLMNYREAYHEALPHIVKFSGGRSSGMMLFMLLENDILKPERGDVVIFNNTSAEHPKTYEFVAKCKEVCEQEYGVPFFLVEHCTYEDAYQGDYIRMPTFRLVNAQPHSETNPDGYRWRGEVYEELLSWHGYVPSILQRTCTLSLKLSVTRMFLKDWFLFDEKTKRRGHFGEQSRVDSNFLYQKHIKNGGAVPKSIFLRKKEFVSQQPHFRREQFWDEFSINVAPINNPCVKRNTVGDKVVFGSKRAEYIGLIGLRNDEEFRVKKVNLRAEADDAENNFSGESVYTPLYETNVKKSTVETFWDNMDWNLNLDPKLNLSNCTFCFLKGVESLRTIREYLSLNLPDHLKNTPSDISWWVRMENLYARNLAAEGRNTRRDVPDDMIGFFGIRSGFFFKYLEAEMSDSDIKLEYPESSLPCDCTD